MPRYIDEHEEARLRILANLVRHGMFSINMTELEHYFHDTSLSEWCDRHNVGHRNEQFTSRRGKLKLIIFYTKPNDTDPDDL